LDVQPSTCSNILKDKNITSLSQNEVPSHGDFDIISLNINRPTLDRWQLQGLLSDELSRENGAICINGPTYPLLIDPQIQAHRSICNRHINDKIIVMPFAHRYFRTHYESTLQDVGPFLIKLWRSH
jgi:dynein heavy chain